MMRRNSNNALGDSTILKPVSDPEGAIAPRSSPRLNFVLTHRRLEFLRRFHLRSAMQRFYGPFLAPLSAIATVVDNFAASANWPATVCGWFPADGRIAPAAFWPIAIFGYFVQLLAVPALALANNWPTAAALIILERIGRAIPQPTTA